MREFSFAENKRSDETCHFTLTGRVSVNEAVYIEQELGKAIEAGCNQIVIDMCLVNLFTSAAIRVILKIHQKLVNKGGKLQIQNPSESVRNVIGMTALDELLYNGV